MFLIEETAYTSKISKVNPHSKIILGLTSLIICLSFNTYMVSILTIIVMGFLSIVYGKTAIRKYLGLLSIPLGFLLLGTVTILISRCDITKDVLLYFRVFSNYYGITVASLQKGLLLILRALGAVSCMYFVSLNTTMNDILTALRQCKIPVLLVSLMELIYRYIFVILQEANKIKIAQHSRLGYKDFKTSMKSLGELVAMVFLRTFLRCDKIYASLQSRGYEGEFKVIKQPYQSSKVIWLLCVVINLLLLLVGIWEAFCA